MWFRRRILRIYYPSDGVTYWNSAWRGRSPIHVLRRFVYKKGYRPKSGSILFSPTLSLFYVIADNHGLRFAEGISQGSEKRDA